ncbi:MAG TPA: DUF362 domain-containing protein, partial [Vicinamibacteria bacterium]
MSTVYDEFVEELRDWQRRYQGRPEREMVRLCLLSLEREEIVSVAYREDALGPRLDALALPAEVRALFRQALTWACRDEEMHAIYIRGALLRLGGPWLRALTFARQTAGAVGGWSASVRQHVRWRDAPLSRAAASGFTWAGLALGQVPRAVRRHLQYTSFRSFCLFNVEAERTAWLCWKRLADLAPQCPSLPPGAVADFARVQADEERHRQVFEILAGALDEQDQLRPGQTAEALADSLGAVSEFFLPRSRRRGRGARHPLGRGGPVLAVEGRTADQKRPLFRKLLDDAGLPALLEARAREQGKALGELRVAVKPTFMLGYHRRDRSMVTDPELLEELARYLKEHGAAEVAAVECANIYDRFYARRSVAEVARYLGYQSDHYRVVDSSQEQVPHDYFRGMAQYTVGRTWKEADLRLSFAKLRSHPVELVHLAVANVEWVGGRCDQFLFLDRQAHRETAVMMLLDEFPPHFALLEGYDLAADGLMGVMGCPDPPSPRRLYAGADALAVDLVAARHLGMQDPRESTILRAAMHWFGHEDGAGAPAVVGTDEPVAGWRTPYHSELSTVLSFLAFPVYVLGSGRGALFVPEMDEEAFPPLRPEGVLLRAARRAVRRLIGLRL